MERITKTDLDNLAGRLNILAKKKDGEVGSHYFSYDSNGARLLRVVNEMGGVTGIMSRHFPKREAHAMAQLYCNGVMDALNGNFGKQIT